MFDPYKDQWWNAPPDKIKEAYYMTLRVHYEMPALEAWQMLKNNFAQYPDFFNDPIGTLRREIKIQ